WRFSGIDLPTVFSSSLDDGVPRASSAASVDEGFFQYQGALNADASREARSMALYFRLREAELDYQPGWPALREGRGELFMENGGLRVALSGGRLLDSRIREADIRVPRAAADEAAHLLVDARLQSSVADGLRILQDSPLPTAETFAAWSG